MTLPDLPGVLSVMIAVRRSLVVAVALTWAFAVPPQRARGDDATASRDRFKEDLAGNEEVERIIKTFAGKGEVGDDSDPTPAEDAVKLFETADDLQIELVACEPAVEQPLDMHFDDRGRMWVVQYRQYPFPAGLKVIRYDQYLRAVFDKVPQPPPHGTPGADKITVFEDTDGDGKADKSTTFADGLHIPTALAPGDGGLYVANSTEVLFLKDN